MSQGSYLDWSIEAKILNYLSFVVKSFQKCHKALSLQYESVLCEDVDRFISQVKNSSIIASNASCYKKTADALIEDLKKEKVAVSPDFFSNIKKMEDEIEKLKADYSILYISLKNKIKDLMGCYDKKLSGFSKISNVIRKENNNTSYHIPEMIDVSV